MRTEGLARAVTEAPVRGAALLPAGSVAELASC